MDVKNRIQADVDRDIDLKVRYILKTLGISTTEVIDALWAKIAAEGRVPFDLALTDRQKAEIALISAVHDQATPFLTTKKEVADYLLGDDEDDEY
ncbi:type II toxin-antitoxin system RelB/DinJ family antitoxin [Lacticaseibacillus parakribbianus]|uniref:type II toxin-antitoxin system RelB/DinJ family antitoxin n=1 Tax=Lacticaseibacillus parakribbianus TaxID=2970927 RepID=UPI0021CB18CF|nr:type II toxin-antitoxin system RelB/DinJ family antitoxin [Lacticaseibacillus parakribbianus]